MYAVDPVTRNRTAPGKTADRVPDPPPVKPGKAAPTAATGPTNVTCESGTYSGTSRREQPL